MFTAPPSNSYQWGVMFIAFAWLSIRSYAPYRDKRDAVSGLFLLAFGLQSIGLFLFFVPLLFLRDNMQLYSYFFVFGDLLSHLGLVVPVGINWYLFLRNRLPVWYVLTPYLLLAAGSFYFSFINNINGMSINEQNVLYYSVGTIGAFLYAALFTGLIPTGLYFMYASKQLRGRAKFRSMSLGVLLLSIVVLYMADYLLSPFETDQGELIGLKLLVFSLLIITTVAVMFMRSNDVSLISKDKK